MSEAVTQPTALAAWFKSMKTGTAAQLEAVALETPGVHSSRALEDPRDKRVVMLVEADGPNTVVDVSEALKPHLAAGAELEVFRVHCRCSRVQV